MLTKISSTNTDHGHWKALLTSLVLTAILINFVYTTATAQKPARVKVLIAFSQQPGPDEQALIRGLGGDIKYTYQLVPAIAATVPEEALRGLRNSPHVVIVEPDRQAHIVDAELDNAWGVKRIGTGAIHAGGNLGAGVKIGIFDTGIDLDHPDLAYDPGCSMSFVEGETLDDRHSHGTHVTGTVAGLDNEAGVVGVAPGATLCIYKVFSNSGSADYSDIIAALERAVSDGVQVTNHSYGSSEDPGITVKAAFDNAYAAGLLHVGAAGNYGNFSGTGENCIFPARWESLIATGATTQSDTRAYYSSTCPEVELAAPGDSIYSTMPGGGYGYKSGTSMASPHVAGTAALVLVANPGWSNTQIRAQLQATADDFGSAGRDPWYGFGLVDADEAAAFPNNPPVAENQAVVTQEDTPIGITLTANDPDGDLLTFSVVTGPINGSLSGAAPNLIYFPNQGFHGEDSFTFVANDGEVESNLATVSITVTPAPIVVDTVASGEVAVAGVISGSYIQTHLDDGDPETITERDSGGKPQSRYSMLAHKWILPVSPGTAITLYANAWSSGSNDGDSFIFSYSTDDVSYIQMFTVANTSDAGLVSYSVDAGLQGTIYVRVVDSDHSPGNRAMDTVFVDHLFIRSELQPGDPPLAPTNLSAVAAGPTQIELNWTDNALDEAGFQIERSVDGAGWVQIGIVGADVTSFIDPAGSPHTTYYFRVRAYNTSGSSGYSNIASATTPDGINLGAVGYKVKGIQMTDLTWSGGSASSFDVYRDGSPVAIGVPGLTYTDPIGQKGGGSYLYQVCEAGNSASCSNIIQVNF